jgi:hypothetical protein
MADPVRDFACTKDGEWAVANGDFSGASGQAAVQQGIQIAVGLFEGECYLDEASGVDYFGKILVKNPDPLEVRAEIQDAIGTVPDIKAIYGADLQVDPGTREGSINYAVDTPYTDHPFTDTLAVP